MSLLSQCDPLLVQVDASCGCTLTRASITAMKPSDFEADFWKESGASRIVANWREARITGVRQKAMSDLFMSRMRPIKRINLGQSSQQSVIAPYILIPQQNRVNSNYFLVESGTANANAGVGATPASAWDFTIINEASPWATALVSLENYFLPGNYFVVLYKDSVTGTGRTVQFKVLSSANGDSGGVSKAVVTAVPNISDTTWATYDAADKAIYQPSTGVVIPLLNSVSNYESWCHQYPSELTWKLKAFWVQTWRRTHCYNDEYIKALEAPLLDPLFKKFRLMPIAKQRARQAYQVERDWYNTVFFGQAISDLQTVEGYTDLEKVYDPANPNCLLEYKANALGIRTQLAECSRVIDAQGGSLDLDAIKAELYRLKRYRAGDGSSIDEIDALTDRYTLDRITTTMIQYYKDKYGFDTTRFYGVGEKIKLSDNLVMWNYNTFEFPDEGVKLNVIVDDFFNDHLDVFPTAQKSMGRYFMMVDWSDIWIGVADAKSVTRQTNVADNLYNCVITPVVNHYQLYSESMTIGLDDPNRHTIYTNFGDSCPTLTVSTCVDYS